MSTKSLYAIWRASRFLPHYEKVVPHCATPREERVVAPCGLLFVFLQSRLAPAREGATMNIGTARAINPCSTIYCHQRFRVGRLAIDAVGACVSSKTHPFSRSRRQAGTYSASCRGIAFSWLRFALASHSALKARATRDGCFRICRGVSTIRCMNRGRCVCRLK